jgi:hypothetical protein
MGLLGKAIVRNSPRVLSKNAPVGIQATINGFQQKNPLFHCVVLQFNGGQDHLLDIAEMTALHSIVCCGLSGSNCLLLFPGTLDMELFSHRLSKSTGSTVLFQFSANSASLALETLTPYLQ